MQLALNYAADSDHVLAEGDERDFATSVYGRSIIGCC